MPADDLFVFTDDVVVDVFAFDTDEVVWQNDKQFFKKRNRKLEKKRTQKNQPSVISNCRRFRRNQWLQWRLRLQLQIINVLKNDGCKEKTHRRHLGSVERRRFSYLSSDALRLYQSPFYTANSCLAHAPDRERCEKMLTNFKGRREHRYVQCQENQRNSLLQHIWCHRRTRRLIRRNLTGQ